MIDAGSKCFELDRGTHGDSVVKGYGTVAGHPELTIVSLSEEVGFVEPTSITIMDVKDPATMQRRCFWKRYIPSNTCVLFETF